MESVSQHKPFNPITRAAMRFTVYGGTLGGNGVCRPVYDQERQTISPGASIGTLTLANGLTFESGSTSLFEVTNGASGDLLAVQAISPSANVTLAVGVLGTALDAATNADHLQEQIRFLQPRWWSPAASLNGSLSIDESTWPDEAGRHRKVSAKAADITNDRVTFTVSPPPALSYQWYRYADITGGSPTNLPGQSGTPTPTASAQVDSGFYGVVCKQRVSIRLQPGGYPDCGQCAPGSFRPLACL